MKFLRDLFAKKDQHSQDKTRSLAPNIGESIWSLTDKDLGSLQIGESTVEITLYMYSQAKLKEETDRIRAAQASGTPLNIADTALSLFFVGLNMIAGRVKMRGGGFGEFGPICKILVDTYRRVIEPTAQLLDRGKSAPKVELSVFAEMRGIETPKEWHLDEIRKEIAEGMRPCLQFLNGYRKR